MNKSGLGGFLLATWVAGATLAVQAGSANSAGHVRPASTDQRSAAPAADEVASTLRPVPSLLYILPEGWQSIFGDLDGDGATEIADQNIDKQKLTIHDAVSGVFERDLPISVDSFLGGLIVAGQLDDDSQDELFSTGNGAVVAIDGLTGEPQWTVTDSAGGWAIEVEIAQMDSDPVNEIVALGSNGQVSILDGSTGDVQWSGGTPGPFDYDDKNLSIGDLNGDSAPDLIVTSDLVWSVYYGPGFNLVHQSTGAEHGLATGVNRDGVGSGEILVLRLVYDDELGNDRTVVDVYDGITFQFIKRAFDRPVAEVYDPSHEWFRARYVEQIDSADMDGDGTEEYILTGRDHDSGPYYNSTFLYVNDWNSPFPFPELEWVLPGYVADPFDFADIDDDPSIEFSIALSKLRVYDMNSEELKLYSSRSPVLLGDWPQPRLFTDDFSNPASGWPIVNNEIVQAGYANGLYHLNLPQGGTIAGFLAPVPFDFLDYEVKVDAKWLAGDDEMTYGILFDWLDWDNYTFVLVIADAMQAGVFGYVDGEFVVYRPIWPVPGPLQVWNQVTIRRVREEFVLIVNGGQPATVPMLPANTQPIRAGLISASLDTTGGVIAYDNFSLQEIWRDGLPPIDPFKLSGRPSWTSRPLEQ